jgi:hypothetical protein
MVSVGGGGRVSVAVQVGKGVQVKNGVFVGASVGMAVGKAKVGLGSGICEGRGVQVGNAVQVGSGVGVEVGWAAWMSATRTTIHPRQ